MGNTIQDWYNTVLGSVFVYCLAGGCVFAEEGGINRETEDLSLEAVLERIEEVRKGITDITADFVQRKYFFGFEEEKVYSGRLYYRKPDRMRWEFASPDQSVMVVDKETIWVSLPEERQVQRLVRAASQEADYLLLGFSRPLKDLTDVFHISYEGTTLFEDQRFHVLKLVPAPEERLSGYYTSIELWISDHSWIPERTVLEEVTCDRTTVEFSNIAINQEIPEHVFRFKIPEGYDVIEY